MANRIKPWPVSAQAVNEMTLTTIENVSKAAAASTSLLLRAAGTGTVASALAVRAFLDAIPLPQPVRRDAGEAPAAPVAPVERAGGGEEPARDGIEAPKVIEPHDTEQVASATADVAKAAVAAAERTQEQVAEQAELLADQAEQVADEVADEVTEDVADEAPQEPAEVDTPPVENWDQLTLASARARMRRLSLEELHLLLAYERSHAERQSVVTMLENRIAKVEAGGA